MTSANLNTKVYSRLLYSNSLDPFQLNFNNREDNSKADSSFTNILSYTVIAMEDGTVGYNIYNGNKIIIHQPHKPGQPGTKGFYERGDAEKVARLVIKKILREKSYQRLPWKK